MAFGRGRSVSRTRTWIAGTAVLAVLVLIAGWLLLIAPQRSEAAELRAAAATQRSTNATLQVRLDELVAKSADLPALEARLAAVRARLPAQTELPDLIRALSAGAGSAGLNLTGIVPSTPELITPVAVPAAVDPASVDPATGAPAVAAAPAAGGGEQLYAINVSMTLTGRYAGVSAYVNGLEELTRAFQVTGFTLGEDSSEGAATGSVLLSVQGRVFVLSSVTPEVVVPAAPGPAQGSAPSDIQPTAPAVAN